jgi:hypothetical protein
MVVRFVEGGGEYWVGGDIFQQWISASGASLTKVAGRNRSDVWYQPVQPLDKPYRSAQNLTSLRM